MTPRRLPGLLRDPEDHRDTGPGMRRRLGLGRSRWLGPGPGLRPRTRLALACLAGAVAATGQVPFAILPFGVAGLAAAAWLARVAPGPGAAAWTGWLAGIGYFGVALHWIYQPFLVDAARHGWMAPFAVAFTAAGFALFWALAFGVACWLGRGGGWRFALAFGGALAGAEMTRSLVLTGFPWALPAYIWTETPGAQLVAWIGPFGLTLLTALGAAAVAATRRSMAGALILSAACALPILLGLARVLPEDTPAADAPRLRIVQPNIPQDQKWTAETAPLYFDRLLELTRGGPQDLTIWPETTVPYILEPGHPALAPISDAAGDGPVLLGSMRTDGPRYYNSLLVIGADGRIRDTYDKHHLVPFGEYMPLGDLAGRLGIRGLAASQGFGYSPGDGPRLVDLGAVGRILPLICYEAIFPEEVGAPSERPDWLLQITNDGWFGVFAGPQQHLAQARMRAIEQGLPMIRAANTGISAVIDAAGHVQASLPLGEAGAIDARLPPAGPPTLYARFGDLPVGAAVALCLLLPFGLPRRRETG